MKTFRFTFLMLALGACGGDDGVGDDPKCNEPGTACTWAGIGEGGYNNLTPNAHRLESKFYLPMDVAFSPVDDRAYITDWNNHRIRRVEADQTVVDVVGTGKEGDGPNDGSESDRLPLCAPAGAIGTTINMNHPTDVTIGPDGIVYIGAWHNNKIRMFDPATNLVKAFGNSYGYAGEGAEACHALFNQPKAVEVGSDGTIYTIDQRNVRIRKIGTDGILTTIAGRGIPGDAGDGGDAMLAEFGFDTGTTPEPTGALVVHDGDLLIADTSNHRIRKIDLATGVIDNIAGTGSAGYTGDGGAALQATFNRPLDMELGPDGRLYIADTENNVVRAMDLTTGIVETVVGSGAECNTLTDTCPDLAAATDIALNHPYGIGFDNEGNLYVADTHNHRILKVAK